MVGAYRLDDIRSLQHTLDEKAHNLFKAKDGQAPLQVTRISRRKVVNDEGEVDIEDEIRAVRDEDVLDAAHIRKLQQVRL